jgi:Ca2+-binding RTX toxin-like protein
MARIFAFYSFDYRSLNMNVLISNQTYFEFLDNANEVYSGRTYEDVVVFEYYTGEYFRAYFGGRDVEFNNDQTDVTSGTATGFLQAVWNGSTWVPYWGVQDFTYSAVALANAVQSASRTDDYQVIANILSGNDTISMSPFADVIGGYTGNDTINGNGGNDILYGNNGDDTISGGYGTDRLFGGGGKDSFVFNVKLGAANVDSIIGFNHTDDTILLDDDVFVTLRSGNQHVLFPGRYKENTTGDATDASDRIIYNNSTGGLFYDPDGNGPSDAVRIAVISGSPDSVDHTDFLIVT